MLQSRATHGDRVLPGSRLAIGKCGRLYEVTIMPLNLPDPSTPIDEALKALKLTCVQYPAVRTFGDLLVEVERGNVTDEAVLKALGKKGKPID
jgi:hypothetical protein